MNGATQDDAARTTVVVGAASGMGAAAAHRLAPRGPLLLVDRNREPLVQIAAEIGGRVDVAVCDITKVHEIASVVAGFDRLGALVISAGVSAASGLPGRTILDVNLRGTARFLEALDPLLEEGTVAVCFASSAGYALPALPPSVMHVLDDPLADDFDDALIDALIDAGVEAGLDMTLGLTCYALSKRGIQRLVRRLAEPWGARGARILSISPGVIDTPMARREAEAHPAMADVVAQRPIARWGSVDEIAAVVEFLTSDGASFMTGSDIPVDGGGVAQTLVRLDAAAAER